MMAGKDPEKPAPEPTQPLEEQLPNPRQEDSPVAAGPVVSEASADASSNPNPDAKPSIVSEPEYEAKAGVEAGPSGEAASAAGTGTGGAGSADAKLHALKASVHEELLEHAGHEHAAHHRVVAIAVDQSDHSKYSFDWAVANLLNAGTDQVVLLNVRDVVNVPVSFGLVYMDIRGDDFDWIDQTEKEYMEASHRLLKHLGAQLVKAGFKCRAIALRGDPRDEILHKARELGADMLVIGSRGMGSLKRAFLGSVSDYCVHNSPCPVVVVRKTHEKKQ